MPDPKSHRDGQLDRHEIERSFGRAASNYEKHAWLQREVRSRLYERLDNVSEETTFEPYRIVDIGCGPAFGTLALKQRYPKATVTGLDLAFPMCRQASLQNQHKWRQKSRINVVQADTLKLPLAAHSVDLLISNLTLQWIEQWPDLLAGFRRVLKPQGLLLFSSFGPDTLVELRDSWAQIDHQKRVNEFIDQHIIGDQLLAAGFVNPVIDIDRITATYDKVTTLLNDLKTIGAHNAHSQRQRSLTGKSKFNAMQNAYEGYRNADGSLPATWEVMYAVAWGPEPGQPIRGEQGETAAFSVESLRRTLKQ